METEQMCCTREPKVYQATDNDPLAQICDECKYDKLVKWCIRAMHTLNTERRLQVITEFYKVA